MQKVQAKIQLQAICNNAQRFKSLVKTRLCAVVKANAYGHGAEEVVCALQGIVDGFAVALLDEALAIRTAACGKDILVFTPPLHEEDAYTAAVNGFIASVPDLCTAKLLVRTCEKFAVSVRVHLKVNTGMNRYGMNAQSLGKVCKLLQACPFVQVEGIYSHLYGNTRACAYAQRERFCRLLTVCQRYFPSVIAHLSATYGALLGHNFRFDMCRIGLGLYGYLPESKETEVLKERLGLQKAMAVYAQAVGSRKLAFGGLGYGKTYEETELQAIGKASVLRFGYADGFLRKKQNGTLHCDKNADALCMDVCIRKQAYARGELVCILQDADSTASQTGTVSYEVLCAATRRAEFVYEDGEE